MPGFIGVGYSEYGFPPTLEVASTIFILATSQGLYARDPDTGLWDHRASAATVGLTPLYGASPRGRPNTLVVTDAELIARSLDAGVSWDSIPIPAAISGDEEIAAIAMGMNSDDTIYIMQGFGVDGTLSGVYKTEDAGTSWTRIVEGTEDQDGNQGLGVVDLYAMQTRLWYSMKKVYSVPEEEDYEWQFSALDGSNQNVVEIVRDGTPARAFLYPMRESETMAWLWESHISGVTAPVQFYRYHGGTIYTVTPPTIPVSWVTQGQIDSVIGFDDGLTVMSYEWDDGVDFFSAIARSTNFGSSWSVTLGGSDNTDVRGRVQAFPPDGVDMAYDFSDRNKMWCLRSQDGEVNYSTDAGNTWGVETVSGLLLVNMTMILASG